LITLEEMVTEVNMSLYSVELDVDQFDLDLVENILRQTDMNRAIQDNLKPRKIHHDDGLVEI
jgi:hypothetical protein